MGQPVTVVATKSSRPNVVRYETNRPLTGMGHEVYRSADDIVDDRPPDELARRLFDHGGVELVSVSGNIITVQVADLTRVDGIKEIVEELFLYYHEGDPPPEVEEE
jgi:hypothetical protein